MVDWNMQNTNHGLAALEQHFDRTKWPLDISREKYFKRARVADDGEVPGVVVVEIERHRSMLGTSYVKGLGMAAFEEYFMRYAVDLANGSVTELAERHGHYQFDTGDIVGEHLSMDSFSLDIEPIENGQYSVKEDVFHEEQVTASLQETRDFVFTFEDRFVESFSDKIGLELGDDDGAERNAGKLLLAYTESLRAALLSKADDLWARRDD